jgi:hypothetical protein
MSYNVNEKGYYGDILYAIPEMLYPNEELRQNYLKLQLLFKQNLMIY